MGSFRIIAILQEKYLVQATTLNMVGVKYHGERNNQERTNYLSVLMHHAVLKLSGPTTFWSAPDPRVCSGTMHCPEALCDCANSERTARPRLAEDRDDENPRNVVSSEEHIGYRQGCENEATDPLPSPGHSHDSQKDEHRRDVNGEIGKLLDKCLPGPEGIQSKQAQKEGDQNPEDPGTPKEQRS